MNINRGVDLALDRILKGAQEEQLEGIPEAEQLERLPRLLGLRSYLLKPTPSRRPPRPIPMAEEPPPLLEEEPVIPQPTVPVSKLWTALEKWQGLKEKGLGLGVKFSSEQIEKISNSIGAMLTAPFRAKALGELAREYPVVSFLPGGRGYKQYLKWKGSPEEPALETAFPTWKQWGEWLKPLLKTDFGQKVFGIDVSKWEEPERYEWSRMGIGETVEFLPFLFLTGGQKKPLEEAAKLMTRDMVKGISAETAANTAFMDLKIRGLMPKFKITKEVPIIKPTEVKPITEIKPPVIPAKVKPPVVTPIPPEVTKPLPLFTKEVTERIIKQGRQADLAIRLGWLDKEGQLTVLGKLTIDEPLGNLSSNIRPLAMELRKAVEAIPKLPEAAIPKAIVPEVIKPAIPEVITKVGVEPAEPILKNTVDKFVSLSGRIRASIYRTETLRKPVRAAQRARMATIAEERKGLETLGKMSAQRAGELPKAGFESITDKFTISEVTQLHNVAIDAFQKGFVSVDDAVNASKALDLYMKGIQMPRKFELKLFKEIYGDQFAEAVQQSTIGEKVWRNFLDASGLLRANKASTDISGTLRQGLIYFARRPQNLPKNVVIQIKSIFSAKYAQEFDDALRITPTYLRAKDEGVRYFATFGGKGRLGKMEENFMTRWTNKLPWVRVTERGYVNGLNKMRLDRAMRDFALLDKLEAQGIKITDVDRNGLATLTNAITGRGDLPKAFQNLAPVLNNLLFSPRYIMSRLEFPTKLLSSSSIVRKEAAKDVVALLAWGSGILGAVALVGRKVEMDSRSSDFGKLIIGNTRIDIWSGYAQYARFLRQMQSGERKTLTGEIMPVNRSELLIRFGQSKLAPGFGLIQDLLAGETYAGQKIEFTPKSMRELGINTLVPMALADIYDAARIDGMGTAIWGGILSATGVGISTYEDISKPEWAKDFKIYNDIPADPMEVKAKKILSREQYRERNPEIDAKLFIAGRVSSIKTEKASSIVKQIIQDEKIDSTRINAVKNWQTEQKQREKLGVKDISITPTDRLIMDLLKGELSSRGIPTQRELKSLEQYLLK